MQILEQTLHVARTFRPLIFTITASFDSSAKNPDWLE
jgi:hypothetical protein